jgi:hypothetical protein
MLGALLYLRITSLRNWLRTRLQRLRQPKYFAGALAFAAYFWFFFYRPLTHTPRPDAMVGPDALQAATALATQDWLAVGFAVGSLALLVFLALMWIVPTKPASLGFSEAEIAFLFPAPVTRRSLVHFRLLSAQFRSLVGGAFMVLFSNRWTMLGGTAVTHAIGWWFIFSALNLHFSGAGFTLTRLGAMGRAPWRRRALVLVVLLAVVAATFAQLPAELRLPQAGHDLRPLAVWVTTFTNTAPLNWLLWPMKLVLGPFLAPDLWGFLLALPTALAVISLHYLWVVRTAVAFEDASLEYAEKRAARIAAWRSGNRRTEFGAAKGRVAPFHLASVGRPELAFLWKNLLSAWPYFTPRVFAGCALFIAATTTWLNTLPAWRGLLAGIGTAALVFAAYALIVGPHFARQDLRSDLPHLDILKTYPLPGWQIVLGQMLAPAAILTGVLWLVLLTAAMTLPGRLNSSWLTPEFRLVSTMTIAGLTPVVVTLQLLVPNTATLLFPGWFQVNRGRGGGMEVVGQRMIFFFAQLLTMVLALLPAALLAGLLIFIFWQLSTPTLAIAVGGLTVLAILLGEIWCGLWWLGQRFDRLDFSSDLRP